MKRSLVAAALLAMFATGIPAARAATAQVQIRNNTFEPSEVRVGPGDTVRWTLIEGRHTVTSDIRSFDSGEMRTTGDTFSFTAPRRDVTIYFHCRLHGARGDGTSWGPGMVGRIVVGAGSPVPHTRSEVEVRRVSSRRWRTVDAALRGLEPDRRYRLELAPGRYRPLDLTAASLGFRGRPDDSFELTIRGTGAVVFRGAGSFGMSVDGLRLEHVTFDRTTVLVRDADRWSVDDVVVRGPTDHGVRIEGARQGRLRNVSITGAGVAGISVEACSDCDLLVDRVRVERSLQGLSALDAGSLVVRGSVFRDNGVGIAIKAHGAPPGGAHIYGNTFRDNTSRKLAPPPLGPERDLPVGAGVWIDGGWFATVERNRFDGHSFGVAITGTAYSSRVEGNRFARSREADLAWDGLGADVCFSGNVRRGGGTPSAMPAIAQELYDCELPATIGIPYPVVSALLWAWGLDQR